MGAGYSGFAAENSGCGLGDLPESCIALVLVHLEPSEICRVARVNTTFRRASLSDGVWESKLPENHQILVKKLFGDMDACSKKQNIYARLATPLRFGSDTKEVWLDKRRGGISVAVSWKGLKISGVDDRRYWSHIQSSESRFGTVVCMKKTWWVQVEGSLEFEFPVGSYGLFFRLQLNADNKINHARGWDVKPVTFQLQSSNSAAAKSERFLKQRGRWLYHHAGDFVVENSSAATHLNFSMTQIDCTHIKAGLCLDSVFVFPTNHLS